jgi:hypothetical protein
MKKVMKSFMAMALGLSLVLAGCSKDDDDPFEGDYAARVIVEILPMPISTILKLSKNSKDYTASAQLSLQIPEQEETPEQKITGSLSLALTSVKEKAGGVVSYSFDVVEQTLDLSINGNPMPLAVSGSGTLSSAAGKYNIKMSLTADMDPSTTEDDISVDIEGTK